jgi:hypothetical protein
VPAEPEEEDARPEWVALDPKSQPSARAFQPATRFAIRSTAPTSSAAPLTGGLTARARGKFRSRRTPATSLRLTFN